MSLDGFVADANGDVSPLYPDLSQGSMKDNELVQEAIESTRAVVMGRGAYDMAQGDFSEYEYQVPIFVLTHHSRDFALAHGHRHHPSRDDRQLHRLACQRLQ